MLIGAATVIGIALAAAVIAAAVFITSVAWRGGWQMVPSFPHGAPLQAWRMLKRVLIAIIGSTVLLVGVSFLVLPGPAFLVLPAGLAILATEFAWARHLLHRAREALHLNRRRGPRVDSSPPPPSGSAHGRGSAGRSPS